MVFERNRCLLTECPRPLWPGNFGSYTLLYLLRHREGEPASLKGGEPSTLNTADYGDANNQLFIGSWDGESWAKFWYQPRHSLCFTLSLQYSGYQSAVFLFWIGVKEEGRAAAAKSTWPAVVCLCWKRVIITLTFGDQKGDLVQCISQDQGVSFLAPENRNLWCQHFAQARSWHL